MVARLGCCTAECRLGLSVIVLVYCKPDTQKLMAIPATSLACIYPAIENLVIIIIIIIIIILLQERLQKVLLLSNIIIIIMKNFNRCSSYGHHGSKRLKLAQHTHYVDRTHSLTHLHQHSHNHFCAKHLLSYYRI